MIRRTLTALALAAALLLAGCSSTPVHGYVVDRYYKPGYLMPITMSDGRGGTYMSFTYIPESYYLVVRQDDDSLEEPVATVQLPGGVWSEYEVNDRYDSEEE